MVEIYEGKITLEEVNEDQENRSRTRPQNDMKIQEKNIVLKNLHKLFERREKLLDGFDMRIFLIKSKGSGLLNTNQSKLKILTSNQMLQRLPIALAQIHAGNNSENLLNEISQIAYSLYQSKKITKKVDNNIIKSK